MSTVRQLARAAQVSPATVSFVLSGRKGVGEQTRQRVNMAIERLGYRRQGVGRPRPRQGFEVALVCGAAAGWDAAKLGGTVDGAIPRKAPSQTLADLCHHEWIDGVQEHLTREGDRFHLYAGFTAIDQADRLRQRVEAGEIDGVILMWTRSDDGFLDWLTSRGVPVVVVNRRPASGQAAFSYVEMDNEGGGRQAAALLLAQGHRRLALLQGDRQAGYNQRRTTGFLRELAAVGVEPVLIREVHPTDHQDWRAAAQAVLERAATAVFATTDTVAVHTLNAWHALEVAVPGQVALVGFDNREVLSDQGVLMTSVGYSGHVLGSTAAHLLRHQIGQEDQVGPMTALVRTRVVHGQTTAP